MMWGKINLSSLWPCWIHSFKISNLDLTPVEKIESSPNAQPNITLQTSVRCRFVTFKSLPRTCACQWTQHSCEDVVFDPFSPWNNNTLPKVSWTPHLTAAGTLLPNISIQIVEHLSNPEVSLEMQFHMDYSSQLLRKVTAPPNLLSNTCHNTQHRSTGDSALQTWHTMKHQQNCSSHMLAVTSLART